MSSPSLAGTVTDFPLPMFVNEYEEFSFTLFGTRDIDSANVELLLQHYVNAVQDALAKISFPESTIDDIDLSSETERRSVVQGTITLKPSEPSRPSVIPVLFEAQVIFAAFGTSSSV